MKKKNVSKKKDTPVKALTDALEAVFNRLEKIDKQLENINKSFLLVAEVKDRVVHNERLYE